MKAQLPALLLDYRTKPKKTTKKKQANQPTNQSLFHPFHSFGYEFWCYSDRLCWLFLFAKRSGPHKPVPCCHALDLVIGICLHPRNHRHFLCCGHLATKNEADTHKLISCWPPSDHKWAGALIHSWLVPHSLEVLGSVRKQPPSFQTIQLHFPLPLFARPSVNPSTLLDPRAYLAIFHSPCKPTWTMFFWKPSSALTCSLGHSLYSFKGQPSSCTAGEASD